MLRLSSLTSLRLTQRFVLVFIGYFVSMAAVIGVSAYGLMSARDSLRALHDESLQRILLADAINENALQSRTQVLLAFQHAPDNTLSSLHEHPTAVHFEAVLSNIQRAKEITTELLALVSEPAEKEMLTEALRVEAQWTSKLHDIVRAMQSGDFSSELMGRFLALGREEGDTLVALMGAFKGLQVANADVAYQEADKHYQFGLWVFVLAVLLGGVPATALSVSLLRRMQAGFKKANATAKAISDGDISVPVTTSGNDEISELLRQMEDMRLHLHDIIARVRSGADAIAGASTEVAVGTGDLSMRTEQQAASLEQTASATEQLSGTVQQNADSAARASELATNATAVAQRGGQMVAQVVSTMQEINTSARRIEDIIGVIDGIAFQTNILALNAAVEAARAGEQGRGFAVVAGEVRSLAQRSAEAAKEIKVLITASVDKVSVGTEQVDRAGATMQDIVTGIARVADIVSEIAEASREQSKGLAQINDAVSNLDDVTQQNAALVEETSAASSALQEQARQMAEMSAQFRLEQGAASQAALYAAPALAPAGAARGAAAMGQSRRAALTQA